MNKFEAEQREETPTETAIKGHNPIVMFIRKGFSLEWILFS